MDPGARTALTDAVRTLQHRVLDELEALGRPSPDGRPRGASALGLADWARNLPDFRSAFLGAHGRAVDEALAPARSRGRPLDLADLDSLALVDDQALDEQMAADRFALDLELGAEPLFRGLERQVAGLRGEPARERNPLHPGLLCHALMQALPRLSEVPETRQRLVRELPTRLITPLRETYGQLHQAWTAAGLAAEAPRPAPAPERPPAPGPSSTQRAALRELPPGGSRAAMQMLGEMFGLALDPSRLAEDDDGAPPAEAGDSLAASLLGTESPTGPAHLGPRSTRRPAGSLDGGPRTDELLGLIRRLAAAGVGSATALAGVSGSLDAGPGSGRIPGGGSGGGGLSAGGPVNLIRAHREDLVRASSGALDHMVIDIVASLFDQVLADAKVPPQMARQIARLQMPVLRIALKDIEFFRSRRHPVRRFVNRVASLSAGFADFDSGPGRELLERVTELVHAIVEGDFEQLLVYEQQLEALEALVAEQTTHGPHAPAARLLDRKETELRIQQRYMRELSQRLGRMAAVPPWLRDFLAQVWSQVQVRGQTQVREDPACARATLPERLIRSLQPMAQAAARQAFLRGLPGLLHDLREGLDHIGWPAEAREGLLRQLLPLQAAALRAPAASPEAEALLAQQLIELAAVPIPRAEDLPAEPSPPLARLVDAPPTEPLPFSAEEARAVGLLDPARLATDAGEPPPPDPAAPPDLPPGSPLAQELPPSQGAALIAHLSPGGAYRMHLGGQWQRVRLAWMSPGRSFFIFNHGRGQLETLSLTARMLLRMCEAGRLQALEQAGLLDRASARARAQLAQA